MKLRSMTSYRLSFWMKKVCTGMMVATGMKNHNQMDSV